MLKKSLVVALLVISASLLACAAKKTATIHITPVVPPLTISAPLTLSPNIGRVNTLNIGIDGGTAPYTCTATLADGTTAIPSWMTVAMNNVSATVPTPSCTLTMTPPDATPLDILVTVEDANKTTAHLHLGDSAAGQ